MTGFLKLRQSRFFRAAMIAGGAALVALSLAIVMLDVMMAERSEYRARLVEYKELQRAVEVLDSQLTIAAQLYAQRGEPRWIATYDQHLAELDVAIVGLQALATTHEAERYGQVLFAANESLIAFETDAFAAAAAGRLPEAQAIIFSQAYEQDKVTYAQALQGLGQAVALNLESSLRQSEAHGPKVAGLLLLTALLLGFAAWNVVRHRRHEMAVAQGQQAALDASRKRLREGLAFVNAAVFEIDFVNRHIINDESTVRLFGRSLQFYDMIGRGRGNPIVHAQDQDLVNASVASCREANADRLDMVFRLRDAEPPRWIAMHGLIERNAEGQPLRSVEFAQDVTAHKMREIALAEADAESARAAARLGLALEAYSAVVWELDLVARRVVDAEALATILGFTPTWEDTFVGAGGMHHPDDWGQLQEAIEALYAKEPVAPAEHRVFRRDGAIVWMSTGMRCLFDEAGNPIRIIMVSCDITERRTQLADFSAAMERAEESLIVKRAMLEEMGLDVGATADPAASPAWRHRAGIGALFQRLDRLLAEIDARDAALAEALMAREEAREAAELANTAKSQFLANMSHELRTPLNAVIGYAEIIDEDLEAAGMDPQRKDLARIRAAARHLLSLINEVLDLSKIEAGRMDVTPEPFSLAKLVAEAVDTVTPAAAVNGNRVTLTIDPKLDQAFTDLRKLNQCLLNLLSNAAKFTKDGVIAVSVTRRPCAISDIVDIRVSDTGIGISSDQMARLFQPFVQADATNSRSFGGTGLGLAITRKLAQLLGGDVLVASQEGQGSAFTLSLPLVYETAVADDKDASQRGGPVVLVIDDAAEARDLARRALSRLGFDVRGAATVAEGLRASHALDPVAIVLDVGLPDGSGWDLLADLKRHDATHTIPVIVHTIEDDATRSLSLGAVMHLRKPVGRAELAATVTRFAARRVQGATVAEVQASENGERRRG